MIATSKTSFKVSNLWKPWEPQILAPRIVMNPRSFWQKNIIWRVAVRPTATSEVEAEDQNSPEGPVDPVTDSTDGAVGQALARHNPQILRLSLAAQMKRAPTMEHWKKISLVFYYLGMGQYLLIPFLVGWTSIYQLFWCSPGYMGFDPSPLDQGWNA